jgi:hypothetical protein
LERRAEAVSLAFRFYPLRFDFVVLAQLHFPPGQAANMLRGSFGAALKKVSCASTCPGAETCPDRATCSYARLFEPRASGLGPSGLRDWPRPFVFRTAHLDGATVPAGAQFHIDVNLFDMRPGALPTLGAAFAQLGRDGFGSGPIEQRARAELSGVEGGSEPLVLSLDPTPEPVRRVLVRFLTPTELKGADSEAATSAPPFALLAARLRDRLSTLRALYGEGPLAIDFQGFGERAAQIKLIRCDTHAVSAHRRSRRTGQTHSLGGLVGEVEYEGDLAEFLPYLRAGRFTGAGRQTVWGKGEIDAAVLS